MYYIILSIFQSCRAMLGLAAVPSITQLIGFLFLPESPRWLVRHGKHEQAKQVLMKMVGEEDAISEYSKIQHAEEEQKILLEHESKGRQSSKT